MSRKSIQWSISEHAKMLKMRGEGFTTREIAGAIGRSYFSVQSRLAARKVYRRAPLSPGKPLSYERVTVDKSEVVALYEQGWRFVGFDGARCIFQRLA